MIIRKTATGRERTLPDLPLVDAKVECQRNGKDCERDASSDDANPSERHIHVGSRHSEYPHE